MLPPAAETVFGMNTVCPFCEVAAYCTTAAPPLPPPPPPEDDDEAATLTVCSPSS